MKYLNKKETGSISISDLSVFNPIVERFDPFSVLFSKEKALFFGIDKLALTLPCTACSVCSACGSSSSGTGTSSP